MYVAIILLILLLALEWLLRTWQDRASATRHHGPIHYAWSFEDPSGEPISRLKGDLRLCMHPFTVYANAPHQKAECFTINGHGLRTDPCLSPQDIRDSRQRVFILGGSAAFGTGLKSNDETYAAHLARLIKDAHVLNAGVIGFVSGQEVAQLVSDLVDYKPDLVITLDGVNDLFIQFGKNSQWPGMRANEFDSLTRRLVRLHRIESSIFSSFLLCFRGIYATLFLMRQKVHRLVGRHARKFVKLWRGANSATSKEAKLNREMAGMSLEDVSELYAANLSKITRMGKGFGFRHLAVLQPMLVRDLVDAAGRFHFAQEKVGLYERFLRESIQRLDRLQVAYYDAHRDFRDEAPLFLDDVHLTSDGYKRLADETCNVLKRKGMLPLQVRETLCI